MRVLIADDDAVTRKIVASTIAPYGDVIEVKDGQEALDLLTDSIEESHPFDLVVLDISMPQVDGLDVLAAIRILEEDRGVPPGEGVKTIFVTGHTDSGDIYDAHAMDCDVYLVKPVDTQKLVSHIRRLGLIREEA